jgi:hypothetical protein
MPFNKSTLKKQMEVEDGEAAEVIDLRLQYEIFPGEKYEEIRSALHKRLDLRFNEMFAAELGLMPQRVKEGESWVQRGMFDDAL